MRVAQGVPVYIERSGMLEMNSVLEKGTTVEELVRLHVVSMEVRARTVAPPVLAYCVVLSAL